MAKMLGTSVYSGGDARRMCWCPDCRPPRSWHPTMKRAQRSREVAATRAEILDELVADAAEHNLYELTAEPRATR